MKEAEHTYTGPTTSREIPDGVARYLDGTELLTKTQALRLSTVDSDGWPHAALLSAGDMVMMPDGHIRFALFPKSTVWPGLMQRKRARASCLHRRLSSQPWNTCTNAAGNRASRGRSLTRSGAADRCTIHSTSRDKAGIR